MKPLPPSYFAGDAVELAQKLLGKVVRKGSCAGIIVETEAYGTDPASHAVKMKKRGALMRETYGHWYIYFTYGMHWCANVTTNKNGIGAVLIRAVEPTEGIPLMKRRRRTDKLTKLSSGPACFTQAFGITGKDNNVPVDEGIELFNAPDIPKKHIVTSPRIGISKGKELPWRFYIKDNPFVSKLPKKPARTALATSTPSATLPSRK